MAVIYKDGITQDTSSGKIYSVGDTTAQYNGSTDTGNSSSTKSSTMTLDSARAQADQAFSGLVSPMSVADIKAREAEQKAASTNAANAQFNPQIDQTQKAGMATVSTAEGVTGQRQGFNISTAESAYLSGIQQEVVGRVKEVENQKAAAIQSGDLAAIQRADDAISKLNDYNNQLVLAKANYALQIMSGNREQAQLDLATQQASLQANKDAQTLALQSQELALNAYKTALDTPIGKDFTVNGKTYTGLKNVSGIDPANIALSTDDKGYETGVNKLTGEVLWKSKVPTGKTKTAAASVNINMPSYGSTPNKVYDKDGKFIGTSRYDAKSDKVIKQDINGNLINAFPADATIVAPTDNGDGLDWIK